MQGRTDLSLRGTGWNYTVFAVTAEKNKTLKRKAIENAGLCMSRIPDLVRAEAHFHKALQINPNMSKSILHLAEISYQQQDYQQAKDYMKRYQSVSLWNPQALLITIKIENKLGEEDEVASHILLLKGKFPDSDQAQQVRRGEY